MKDKMKLKKTLTGILATGLICLTGCINTVKGTYESYSTELIKYFGGRNVIVTVYDHGINPGIIQFNDINDDGRIDKMDLSTIKKGSSLENYASLEEGQKIYKALRMELNKDKSGNGEQTKWTH